MKVRALFLALALATAPAAMGGESSEPWRIVKMLYSVRGDVTEHGYTLYTTGKKEPGAAFRCNSGKLYAIVGTRALDIGYWITQLTNSAKLREVTFSVNGRAPKTEEWASIYGGRMMITRRISSTNLLYQAALQGGDVVFGRRKSESLKVVYPQPDPDLFDAFLDKCELDERNHPHTTL